MDAIIAKLKEWFTPPPQDQPAEVLRWVRRLMVATAILYVLAILPQLWMFTDGAWWLGIPLGLFFLSWLALPVTIRSVERQGPLSDENIERGRARGRRIGLAWAGAAPVAGAVAGYLLDGPLMAVLMGVLIGLGAAIGVLALRRWYD